jgi:hypothetical protein
MYLAVQNHYPALTANPLMRITAWQIAYFFSVIGLIWLNEIFDFQSKLFGAPPPPGERGCAVFLTIGVTLLSIIAIFLVHRQDRETARRAVTICSYCSKVQVNERAWEKIEIFCSERMHVRLSHGVCPDCGERVMRDYRRGKKNAGSRETIRNENGV